MKLVNYNNNGLEIVIDTQTGEAYASQRAVARMCNIDERTIRRYITAAQLPVKKAEVLTATGLKTAALLNEFSISECLFKYNPNVAKKMCVVNIRVSLHQMAGYEVNKSPDEFTIEVAQTLITSTDEFPVHFDDMWQWLGYTRKDNAKRNFLNAGFLAGVDFRIFLTNEDNSGAGRPTEEIQMTVDCAKQWAMMSGTAKGKQVRLYFIQCERQLKEVLQKAPVRTLSDREVTEIALNALTERLNQDRFCDDKPGLARIIAQASKSKKALKSSPMSVVDIASEVFNVKLDKGEAQSLGRFVAGTYKAWYNESPKTERKEINGVFRRYHVYDQSMYATIQSWLIQEGLATID